MYRVSTFLRRSIVFAVLLHCVLLYPSVHAAPLLTIGSKAPALEISNWIQQGGGKYPKVSQFETGKSTSSSSGQLGAVLHP